MNVNVDLVARTVQVDNRIPLRNYYRIADNLLKQASIYREEKNVVDLYIMLLRYSSLVSETIPFHRDYQVLLPKERTQHKKRLSSVLDEAESLKPEYLCRVDELKKAHSGSRLPQLDGPESTSRGSDTSLEWAAVNRNSYLSIDMKQYASVAPQSSWKYNNHRPQGLSSNSMQIEQQFQNLSFSLPPPKKETLSRHSFFGPNGLRGQWLGPSAETKVQYPNNMDLNPTETSGLNQAGQCDLVAAKDGNPTGNRYTMESVLSLDDGRWSRPTESCSLLINESREDPFQLFKQPSIPPVLAQLQQDVTPIPPSKVADPRPGPAKSSQDGMPNSESYQHLHIPVKMMEDFLRLARANTQKNLETCGVLAGLLKNKVFHITSLIIPKQESTADSCQTLNEEEIFEVQDKLSLFQLGWIHTHPSQTCFMSSVDLHTHYSYQVMLPEAIAIVMAPTDTSSPHGIFHLSDPAGVSMIRNCQQRGFHPHEETPDGNPIYEHCSHVYMNPNLKFDVVDLR
ncbi:AMSH-like ubiquitin thioesterase 3 [Juglans microcarpa x Juglans regia]|uniref:AMSH-like ubiquitin thioesterase 3 n=1 Tax=Juglans microcarpa x Juglans regia TaxID=2249226 RepID=UPI001B7E209E|nr:AMSH-like ubiquitin thioesterase 3 [Juglans microcarpa x Juglans regia]XP_041025800.1 AMSH-like ubiquitin thioesterase 3 [Juglans microcarpa x Juglans regia]XP_041025805.1 AMSH-like ubiquitin thioesterase 3 [Juglans microcarpa x Juglans regia]